MAARVMDATGWQQKLDGDFPAGLALNYLPPHPDPDASARIMAWIGVDGMTEDTPHITIYPAGLDRNPFEIPLFSYTPKRGYWQVESSFPYAMTWTPLTPGSLLGSKVTPWREYWQNKARMEVTQ